VNSKILALLTDLEARGVVSACVQCPVCERDRKFSVTFRDGLALYCCHRTSCGVRGVRGVGSGPSPARSRPAFTPRPLTAEYRLPVPGSHWWTTILKLADQLPTEFATDNGFRVLSLDPDTAVWLFERGAQTRTVDKRVQTWRHSDGPFYGRYHDETESYAGPVFVHEDPMSAALCPAPSIALLGTHITRETATEITDRYPFATFIVNLDLDRAGIAATIPAVERLRATGVAAFASGSGEFKHLSMGERHGVVARWDDTIQRRAQ